MDDLILQDRLNRAAGRAASLTGAPHDLLRPVNTVAPLGPGNRILKLHVTFLPLGGRHTRPVTFGDTLWEAVLDSAYTRPGDLLRRIDTGSIYFIAAQQPLLPVLCVRASRRLDITRPAAPSATGLNAYGGTVTATDTTLATGWPASVLVGAGQGTGQSGIAADLPAGTWQVLLPVSLNLTLRIGDRLTDDLGRTAVIATSELSDLGWRLQAQQANT
jgi:hypothetical protein